MRGIKFVNDLSCNYLTIPYEGETKEFELRMMMENAAEFFLQMELRRLDGQISLYYNISGMQSMEILYGEKLIDKKLFHTFMWQLHETIEESRELFLSGDGICMDPKFLFWEWETGHWKFLYVPGRETRDLEEARRERENLAEFLVMHIDYEDKELADTVHQFYEKVYAGVNFPWRDFTSKMYVPETKPQKEYAVFSERENEEVEDEEEESVEEKRGGAEPEETKKSIKTTDHFKRRKRQRFSCVLLCVAVATLVSGRLMPEMMPYSAEISALLAVILIWSRVKEKRQHGSGNRDADSTDYIVDAEPEDISLKMAELEDEYSEKRDITEERTVYMNVQREPEKKLYGVGKCRRQKIILEGMPCLVGKDKTLADHVIADPSVSRMHAKFSLEGETVWMQDLNSTNGTYHNGMRLSPNEKVVLETEDEIGFGQTQFVFR